jgi:hypothetical protein
VDKDEFANLLHSLPLSLRAYNVLRDGILLGSISPDDLLYDSRKILLSRNCGKKTYDEIMEALAPHIIERRWRSDENKEIGGLIARLVARIESLETHILALRIDRDNLAAATNLQPTDEKTEAPI